MCVHGVYAKLFYVIQKDITEQDGADISVKMSSEDVDNMNNETASANGEASETSSPPNGVADEQLPPAETEPEEQLPPPQTHEPEEATENSEDTRPVVELFVKVRFAARLHLYTKVAHMFKTW